MSRSPADFRAALSGAAGLFAATVFLGSFLMFTIEPMIAKILLPILGGSPMVWNTCVMFFQVLLVVGYALAHGGVSALGARRYTALHVSIVALSLAAFPLGVRTSVSNPPAASPIGWLLGVLALSVGPPFLVLAATTPAVQRWFARVGGGRDPYFLYAASNAGSLFGLACYPFLIEPLLGLRTQARAWAGAYFAFALLTAVCGLLAWRAPSANGRGAPLTGDRTPIRWRRRAEWLVLAFIPSSLMLAVTTYLSTDIAAIPLLWVVPLALYLLTFVAAFGPGASRWRTIADDRMPLVIASLAVFIVFAVGGPRWLVITLHLLGLFLPALLCHCELAGKRPPPVQLTEFFLWVAVGGMLGGVFNTLIAPVLFKGVAEYPLVLVLACLFRRGSGSRSEGGGFRRSDAAVAAGIGAVTIGLMWAAERIGASTATTMYVSALLCFSQRKQPLRFAAAVGAMLLAISLVGGSSGYGRIVASQRTFFGIYRVTLDARGEYRSLYHGTTLHGMQATAPERQNEPLSYYHRNGPVGQLFEALPELGRAKEIAAVGLGVGSLASYATAGQHWTFYEIDPAIERIARNPSYFTYLRQCADLCSVVIGDARRSLESVQPSQFNLILLDAFSSDAIPVHLMTQEALELYLSRLAPGGLLAFHISNRHFALGPMLGRLATAHHLTALEQLDYVKSDVMPNGRMSSNWLVMAREVRDLGVLTRDSRWVAPRSDLHAPLWTDDFSNILAVLKFR